MKRKKGMRVAVLIGGTLLIILVPLMTFAVNIIFDPHVVETGAFWINWFALQLGSMCSFGLFTNFQHVNNISSAEYQEKETSIKKIVAAVDTDLGDFLIEFNRNNKKKEYIKSIKQKILKKKEKLVKLKSVKQITPRRQEHIRKVELKIAELKASIAEEYVEKNIDYIKVDYPKISKSQLFSDEVVLSEKALIHNPSKYYSQRVGGRFLTSALISTIIASISVVGVITIGPGFIYSMVMGIFNIAFAGFSGYQNANLCYKKIILPNQLNRSSILKEYAAWKKTNRGE